MNTKLFLGAAALVALASCSQEEVLDVNKDGINYSVSANKLTRAADSYCNADLPKEFRIWANTGDGALYINGDRIAQNGTSWTDLDGARYWPDGQLLNFFAEVNGDKEFDFNNGAPRFVDFTVNDNVKEQLDLMYAVRKNQSKANGTVQLNFRHALSQVCFRAKNNTKNLSVVIKGVTVGHLTNKGTFDFPTSDTDVNYTQHNDNASSATLNGGVWTYPADALYNKAYTVTPLGGDVTLAPGTGVTNLTCAGDNHINTFEQVLTLMPQTVNAWDPSQKGADFNGAYFLVDVVLSNVVTDNAGNASNVVVYNGKAAIPVSVDWKQGHRYIYTFNFDEGGNGGWTPDPSDPKPVLTTIDYDVTVDDFIPTEGEGGDMNAEEVTYNNYSLTYYANGGEFDGGKNSIVESLKSSLAAYDFTVGSYVPVREGFIFKGWSDTANGAKKYEAGNTVSVTAKDPAKVLYAVWEADTQTITLNYDGNHRYAANIENMPAAQTKTVRKGESATFTVGGADIKFDGWVFKGWATSAGGAVAYQPGASITISASTTLFAVWEEKGSSIPIIPGESL